MDTYNLQRLAYTEHNQMGKSLPKVYDFDYPIVPEPSRWSWLISGLRTLVEHVRTSLPKPLQRILSKLSTHRPTDETPLVKQASLARASDK